MASIYGGGCDIGNLRRYARSAGDNVPTEGRHGRTVRCHRVAIRMASRPAWHLEDSRYTHLVSLQRRLQDFALHAALLDLRCEEGKCVGKYVQIRGTEPRLTHLTINGVNVPSVEVTVRNVKMDAIPANGIERIEVYKTLSADQDADGIGGTVNIVRPTAQEKPTYSLNGTAG